MRELTEKMLLRLSQNQLIELVMELYSEVSVALAEKASLAKSHDLIIKDMAKKHHAAMAEANKAINLAHRHNESLKNRIIDLERENQSLSRECERLDKIAAPVIARQIIAELEAA